MTGITEAAERITGKPVGDLTADDLDRIITTVTADMARHQSDIDRARAARTNREEPRP